MWNRRLSKRRLSRQVTWACVLLTLCWRSGWSASPPGASLSWWCLSYFPIAVKMIKATYERKRLTKEGLTVSEGWSLIIMVWL